MTTCLETFSTLRIFSHSVDAEEISRVLGIESTKRQPIDLESKYKHRRERHYWAWSTEGKIEVPDGEVHLRAITSLLVGKRQLLDQLRSRGCEIDVCCYWVSTGQGGPSLDADLLFDLGNLGLSIWWDVYFGKQEDYAKNSSTNVTSRA